MCSRSQVGYSLKPGHSLFTGCRMAKRMPLAFLWLGLSSFWSGGKSSLCLSFKVCGLGVCWQQPSQYLGESLCHRSTKGRLGF